MELNDVIRLALAGVPASALFDAKEQFSREHTNSRGQLVGDTPRETTRIWAVLDVLKPYLMFSIPFTEDERTLLEGLHTKD